MLLYFQQNLGAQPYNDAIANLRVLDLATGKIAWSASYYNDSGIGTAIENPATIANWFSIALAPIITAENRQDYFNKYDLALKKTSSPDWSIIEKLSPEKLAKKKK